MSDWQKAKIIRSTQVASDIKSLVIRPEIFLDYKAGQHYDVCLSGQNHIRKYSVVSPMDTKDCIEFGIQLFQDGVLSPKLWNLTEGDEIEIRGPLGEYFIWDKSYSNPLVLIGAGSGITALLSIYNSYRNFYPQGQCVFIMSAKDASRIMNYDLLKDVLITRFTAKEGRIDLNFLKTNIGNLAINPKTLCYICGPDNFIDDMVGYVSKLGIQRNHIQLERFI